jgi:hypothetical protein
VKRTGSSDPEFRRLGQFQGLIERTSNPRAQAFNHNLSRNVRAAMVLTLVRLLRDSGKKLSGAVTCTRAQKQNFSSSETMTILGLDREGMEAAHFLPGTVTIGGRPIWSFISDGRFRGQIEFMFGEVEHLPAVFNQADTAAEAGKTGGGLCAALAGACSQILQGGAKDIKAGWDYWSENAMVALRTAIAGKAEKGGLPPLQTDADGNILPESISARSNAGQAAWNLEDARWILGYYIEDQKLRGWDWAQTGCRYAINDIQSAFQA